MTDRNRFLGLRVKEHVFVIVRAVNRGNCRVKQDGEHSKIV